MAVEIVTSDTAELWIPWNYEQHEKNMRREYNNKVGAFYFTIF